MLQPVGLAEDLDLGVYSRDARRITLLHDFDCHTHI